MTEATTDRCTYTSMGLRCAREAHPHDPGAHVRIAGSWVPDRHLDGGDE